MALAVDLNCGDVAENRAAADDCAGYRGLFPQAGRDQMSQQAWSFLAGAVGTAALMAVHFPWWLIIVLLAGAIAYLGWRFPRWQK